MRRLLSLIIPCHNESEVLPEFYREIKGICDSIEYDYELLFIDDGSNDSTLAILEEFSEKDPHVLFYSFSRNFGKESAMYAGFCNAKRDYVAVIDADLQDPPQLIPKMLEILESGEYDSVATRRITRSGEPMIRSVFARLFYRIINRISDVEIADGARDFRMMNRTMVDSIIRISENNRFSKGIFGWIGFRTSWLEYDNVQRKAGDSKWSFWKLFKYATDGIINFSEIPLAISSWLGIVFSIVGFIAVVFIVIRKLIIGDPVAGWASTASIIVFMGGIQLFCLGIIGKYLAKVYVETKRRPNYIIAKSNTDWK